MGYPGRSNTVIIMIHFNAPLEKCNFLYCLIRHMRKIWIANINILKTQHKIHHNIECFLMSFVAVLTAHNSRYPCWSLQDNHKIVDVQLRFNKTKIKQI